MKINISICLLVAGILSAVQSKAVTSKEGDYSHMYENIYMNDVPIRFSSAEKFPNYENNFDLRYVPHVDGKPIFIPPLDFNEFETAISKSEKQKPQSLSQYGSSEEIPSLYLTPDSLLKEQAYPVDNLYEKQPIMQETYNQEQKILNKGSPLHKVVIKQGIQDIAEPLTHDTKHKKKHSPPNRKVKHHHKKKHVKDEKIKGDNIQIESNYPNIKEVSYGGKIKKGEINYGYNTQIKDINVLTSEKLHKKPIVTEKVKFPGKNKIVSPIKEYTKEQNLYKSKNKMSPNYPKDSSLEEFHTKPIKEAVSTSYDNKILTRPIVKLAQTDSQQISQLSHTKINTKEPIYNENKDIYLLDTSNENYDSNNLNEIPDEKENLEIEELTKKHIKTKKPSKHSVSKIKIKDSKIKFPDKHDPIKPGHAHKSYAEYSENKWEIKHSDYKPSMKGAIDEEYYQPDVVSVKKKEPAYEYDSDIIAESPDDIISDDYEDPIVVEALIKKDQLDYEEYDSYDKPVVVEALVKKDQSDYDDLGNDKPAVIEELTKKKHKGHTKHKVSNKKEIKPIKVHKEKDFVNKEKDYTKSDLDVNPDYSESYKNDVGIELPIEVFMSANIDNFSDSNSETGIENDLNDVEISKNENDQFEAGSGVINERAKNSEDYRNLYFKSNMWPLITNFHAQERNRFKRCLTPNDEEGNCMPIQMCPILSFQITLEDLMKKVCSIDDIFVGICCPEFPAETLKVKWNNLTENATSNSENLNVPIIEECGQLKRSKGESNLWPWMAPLISVSTRRIFCGGVLIGKQHVLTAAHCTRKIPHNQIIVVLGPISSNKDSINQEFEVIEIKRHAQYNSRTMQNDLAVLKLSRTVEKERSFICLPETENSITIKEALMLGWQGSFEASKNEELLSIISKRECRMKSKIIIPENMLCTEPRNEDVMCNLDSGAPLIVEQNGKYEVVGISTWNRNDCDSRFPSLFTKVSYFQRWIENHISK